MTTLASMGVDKSTTHIGFADEAYWNERRHRYRSVACLYAKAQDYDEIEKELCTARCEAGAKISEIKWVELTDDERRRDAEAVLNAVVKLIVGQKLKADILVWENLTTHSSAEESLQNSYSSILQNAISHSLLEPASNSKIYCSFKVHAPNDRILDGVNVGLLQFFTNAEEVESVDIDRARSALNYMVQTADLLAGMSAYSCAYANDYQAWLEIGRRSLFGSKAPSWQNRFPVIVNFLVACEIEGLGISLGDELRDRLDSKLKLDMEPRIMMHLAR